MHRFPDWSRRTAILLFWLFLWHLASLAVQNQILLVGPLDALKALAVQLASPASWGALWFSFGRISLGFFMAFLAGLLTGSLAFWKPLAGEILEPAIQFMKSVPVASFVILALIWTGHPGRTLPCGSGSSGNGPGLPGPGLEAGPFHLPDLSVSIPGKRSEDLSGHGL